MTNLILIPILPMMPFFFVPLVLKLFGAKLGRNNIVGAAILYDPALVETGNNVVLGGFCIIKCSLINKKKITLKKVKIGDGATVGANSLLEAGIELGENSIIAPGAYVPPFTIIPKNELWGGNPAKFIKRIK
ncbi:hypothetical protein J4408_02090 [Candidatus Pacearchaeota archaeon]|nr:hypothetical protein [Candidatus Pacearchaeota archaeon]